MDKQTERVYLQPAGFHGEEYYSTWASVRVNDADLEYVRADLLTAALARIERLEAILRKYLATADKPMGMSDLADIDAETRTALEQK